VNISLFRSARMARRRNVTALVAPCDALPISCNVLIALDLPLAFPLRGTAVHAALARRW